MPNMFKSVLAAGNGDGADLIVTCTQNFAGSTITLTNGTKTYTQVCPLTSPYEVTFKSIAKGVWTVSGIAQGQTFSTSVTITDFEALLADIPEGSTVTPTDDIQIWLNCANIWDKSYTTISQVLADASTLQTLIASNNAVDYMARSTTWASSVTSNQSAMSYIGLNDYCAETLLTNSTWLTSICNSAYFESVLNTKVPTMTSNTAPSGEAYASYNASGYQAYKAFDGDDTMSSLWLGESGKTGQYVGYVFPNNVKIYKCIMKSSGFKGRSSSFKVQASKTGKTTDMADLATLNNSYTTTNVVINASANFLNPYSAKYYRLYSDAIINQTGQFAVNVVTIQFYGREVS